MCTARCSDVPEVTAESLSCLGLFTVLATHGCCRLGANGNFFSCSATASCSQLSWCHASCGGELVVLIDRSHLCAACMLQDCANLSLQMRLVLCKLHTCTLHMVCAWWIVSETSAAAILAVQKARSRMSWMMPAAGKVVQLSKGAAYMPCIPHQLEAVPGSA